MTDNNQSIAIIGLGAVGFLLTNELVNNNGNRKVSLLGRDMATKQFKRYFQSPQIHFPSSTTKLISSHPPQIIFIASPNPINQIFDHLAKAIKNNPPKKPIIIALLQNGVSAVNTAKKILKKHQVQKHISLVRVNITNAITRNAYTASIPATYDPVKLGAAIAPTDNPLSAEIITDILRSLNFNTDFYQDYQGMQWSKLIFPNLSGYTSTVTMLPLAEALNDDDILKIEILALKERIKVIEAAGIKLVNIPGFKTKTVCSFVKHMPMKIIFKMKSAIISQHISNRSYMLPTTARKIIAGKKTESEFYLKPIIELGSKHKIPTPIHNRFLKIIKQYESKQINPKKLTLSQKKFLLFDNLEI